ncbi:carbohydrate kinase family protein [Candidatus Parcubacteria bacterium]|nr:carbohydrate kinase family protein [Candidatus Parcubacteria bacterium]
MENKNNEQLDFVAIGDIVIDNFIKLKEAEVFKDEESGREKLCMNFADKIPYEISEEVSAVGNSPNAAVSASRLGLKSALITNIGDDENGQKCLDSLKKDGVATDFVETHDGEKTNYHYVLRYNSDRTILVKHAEFDYKFPDIGSPKWIYLSSLAENSLPYHQQILDYLKTHSEIKMSFQPGTFQMNLGYEKMKGIYQRADLFFCNKEEARRILKPLRDDAQNTEIKDLLKMISELGPKMVVITDGPNGAYVYNGNDMWHIPMYPDQGEIVDRTGAGDAFSSTFTAALAIGKTPAEALSWAPINSMSVVQYVGAQKGLLSREKLEGFLNKAPSNYKPEKIN